MKIRSVADEVIPPFGLGYLAEACRRAGHDAAVVDALRDRLDEDGLARRLRGENPGAVGVLLFSKDLVPVRSLLRRIRREIPRAVTIVGGPHPSALPGETFPFFGDSLDHSFAGEAEGGLPVLLDLLSGEGRGREDEALLTVPGLSFRGRDGVLRSNPRDLPEDLDSLDVAWDLIPPGSYPRAPHGAYYRQFPVAPLITSRGCPFHCTFCGAECVSGRKVRRRSPEHVVDEVVRLRRDFGVREIHVEDDNFTGDRAFVHAFCEGLLRRAPGLSWTCPNGVRLDTLDRDMLRHMKASGLYFLSVGIESGSDRVLRRMRKGLTVPLVEEKVNLIREAGIGVSGFFMLGFPGETVPEMEDTVRLALRLPLSRASFANFQPFPGCDEFTALREKGELSVDWESFAPTLQSTTWSPEGISIDTLRRVRKNALRRFYLRPRIVAGMLAGISSPEHALWVLRRGWRWLTISE